MHRYLTVAAMPLLLCVGLVHADDKQWEAERGELPRGTTFELRKPNNWNGTLISDLDFAMDPDSPTNTWFLNHGYAMAGTLRRADRMEKYDPAHEIIDLINVLDLFEAKYGKPRRTIQMGQSGGGNVTLLMAEGHSDRIDGAVALCAHTPIWFAASALDMWFVLKTLIAPELQIVNVSKSNPELTAAWRKALTAAQKTPIGRARIALATTIGQYPAWAIESIPEPDPTDVKALQASMFKTLMSDGEAVAGAQQPGGSSRFMLEQAGGGQLSSNVGVDYAAFFENGEKPYKAATLKLYEAAGVDIRNDLKTLHAAERIQADPAVRKWWSAQDRSVDGLPRVPVMRVHTHADKITPASQVEGYDAAVKANGYERLYRTAFVRGPDHCKFSVAERAAALDTMMERLDTGKWPDTSAEAMNQRAKKLDPATETRYFIYEQFKFNRAWFPSMTNYLGLRDDD